jgi:hypothetical protein
MRTYGFAGETILDRLECFGGFAAFADTLRAKSKKSRAGRKKS